MDIAKSETCLAILSWGRMCPQFRYGGTKSTPKYKGIEVSANWMREIYNTSVENTISTAQVLNIELRKADLANFLHENCARKLTKIKNIYMIYSMIL